jgi:hypothetical protein
MTHRDVAEEGRKWLKDVPKKLHISMDASILSCKTLQHALINKKEIVEGLLRFEQVQTKHQVTIGERVCSVELEGGWSKNACGKFKHVELNVNLLANVEFDVALVSGPSHYFPAFEKYFSGDLVVKIVFEDGKLVSIECKAEG